MTERIIFTYFYETYAREIKKLYSKLLYIHIFFFLGEKLLYLFNRRNYYVLIFLMVAIYFLW